jgi:hypothetical protein
MELVAVVDFVISTRIARGGAARDACAGPPLHRAPDRGAGGTTCRKSHLRVRPATFVRDQYCRRAL